MEELRKLEQVQKVLSLMQSHNITTSETSKDSNRFIANLILLLIQPCGELDLGNKCQLVSNHMSQISSGFLEEVSICLIEEGGISGSGLLLLECGGDDDGGKNKNKKGCSSFVVCDDDFQQMGMVGFDAMQRANSTLEDFLDTFNEKILHVPSGLITGLEKGSYKEPRWSNITMSMQAFKTDPFRPLTLLLESHGFLTERIRKELRAGEEYWALERKLCCALRNKEKISIEDVMRAIHLKSFDYRVLNLLLFQLQGERVNDIHMEFLSASEFLVEIADDLFDYEDDVLENSFNILRMFVRIYGPSMGETMLAKCITEGEEKYNHLLKGLDPQLSLNYQRRCEEATKEGGKVHGPALGTWNIPPVIADEELYRSNLSNHSAIPQIDVKSKS